MAEYDGSDKGENFVLELGVLPRLVDECIEVQFDSIISEFSSSYNTNSAVITVTINYLNLYHPGVSKAASINIIECAHQEMTLEAESSFYYIEKGESLEMTFDDRLINDNGAWCYPYEVFSIVDNTRSEFLSAYYYS